MSGLLADVFSFGNTAKRKIKGLLDDPMGSITQYINNENDRAGRFNQLTAEAAQEGAQAIKSGKSMVGPKSQQLAGLLADAYNPAGMFIGASAKTWDKAAAEKAQKLLKDGVDPRQVWKETGTFKGADGALRQEIDDSGAAFFEKGFSTLPSGVKSSKGSRLDKVVNHPILYESYQGAKKIDPAIMVGGDDALASTGSWKQSGLLEARGPNDKETLGTTLHEIQHAIQQREGWAKGGSPESFPEVMPYDKLVKRNYNMQDVYVRAKLNGGVDPETGTSLKTAENAVNELTKQIKNWKSPDDLYRSLAGEAEARATQARMNMNAAQRRDVYPFDSYDVPVDQLIVRNGLMGDAKSTATRDAYVGLHKAPMKGNGAPLHDLTQVYPDDIYSKNAMQYYGTGDSALDRGTFRKIAAYKGNPDAPVTMYRAVPKDLPEGVGINNGDWVTISPEYAKMHGESALNGEYRIIQKQVPARKLFTNADSVHEFGYDESGKVNPFMLGLLGAGGLGAAYLTSDK